MPHASLPPQLKQVTTTDAVFLNITTNPSGGFLERFGSAVSTNNGTVVVGANLFGGSGRAYLYDADEASGRIELVCDFEPAAGAMPGDGFGVSVAVDGRWVVVGSPYAERASVSNVGEANLFQVGG